MSRLSYGIGHAFGTVVREFLRALKKNHAPLVSQSKAAPHSYQLTPYLPAGVVDGMCHVPAIVRSKGVDLNHWYEVNTRVIQKPPRKRRVKAAKAADQVTSGRLGPLNDLICPVTHLLSAEAAFPKQGSLPSGKAFCLCIFCVEGFGRRARG
ncbi:hypothetical protein D3C77_411580 [compost metagenome]